MERFSVKKPFTILVAVILVIILGVVSLTEMQTDLLPPISLPYMIIVTPYPGASPERVESMVSEPMENALGTISHVKNVFSVSSENYSMTQLEFEDGTDMDSSMVKVSSAVQQVHETLPDGCGTPSILEISMDMVATMYAAVSREGYDRYELSDYVDEHVRPYLARQDGVASVSSIGLVEKSVQVELNADKIAEVNDRILEKTNKSLADAKKELDDAKKKVEDGQKELEEQEKSFGNQIASGLFGQIDGNQIAGQLTDGLGSVIIAVDDLGRAAGEYAEGARSGLLEAGETFADTAEVEAEDAEEFSEQAQEAFRDFEESISEAQTQYEELKEQAEQIGGNFETAASAAAAAARSAAAENDEETAEAEAAVEKAVSDALNTYQTSIGSLTDAQIQQIAGAAAGAWAQAMAAQDAARAAAEGAQGAEAPDDILDAAAAAAAAAEARQQEQQRVYEEISSSLSGARDDAQSADGEANQAAEQLKEILIAAIRGGAAGEDVQRAAEAAGIAIAPYLPEVQTGEADDESEGSVISVPGLPDAPAQGQISAPSSGEIEQSVSDAEKQLLEASSALQDAAEQLEQGTSSSLAQGITALTGAAAQVRSALALLEQVDIDGYLSEQIGAVESALFEAEGVVAQLPEMLDGIEAGTAALFQGQLDAAVGFSEATRQLSQAKAALDSAEDQYETAKKQALENANVDSLVSAATLSQLIYAQNFSMPAGYIDDKDDNAWLLRIGEEYTSSVDISDALLVDAEEIGMIRLSDVADITVIDNADQSFTSVNGDEAVVLAVFKGSTAGTNEVSRNIARAMTEVEEDQPGTHFVTLMDQGEYITLIVKDILTSMGLGAFLAILILALFLRDIRPTLMVGISIPLSVLFTVVLMYFTGLSMNIMTLGGLSLGIGMLVDNSIVVMENIIRLRQRGVSAAGSSVQGARQVSGAIISSTLTTVCVFLPMVFTEGTVRSLLVPMALSITYCLTASLVVALTVIPASASAILRKVKPKRETAFDRVLGSYEKMLLFCLRHKAVPLLGSVAMLALCIVALIRMGIVILPEMTSDTIEMSIVTPEDASREDSYAEVTEILRKVSAVEGVEDIGAMDQAGTVSLISGMRGDSGGYGTYVCYLNAKEGVNGNEVKAMVKEIEEAVKDFPGEVTVSAGGMSDTSALLGSGLSVNIYGNDLDRVREISAQVAEAAGKIEGFENVSDGTEDDDKALHLIIDKDKAMAKGFTVAQIFAEVSARTQTQVTSTSITDGDLNLEVIVKDETDILTRENLLDMELQAGQTGAVAAGMMQGGSGMSGAMAGGMSGGMSGSGSASMSDMFGGDGSSLMDAFSGEESEEDSEEESDEEESDEEDGEKKEEEEEEEKVHRLREFATIVETTAPSSISRENQKRYMTVSAETGEGYNTTLLTRELRPELDRISKELPNGYSIELAGETTQVDRMVSQMSKMIALALSFIYFVMVAQFQSLLSPFIILFTVPLAFTGGMIGLLLSGEQLSMMSLMGFLVLMGTVVNNGIVFVDYTNQLRIGGLSRWDALIATGQTRMRPILMTALTTILAMGQLIFGSGMGSQMSRGMAIVIAGGLAYATLMTLFIIPIMYDILYKKQPISVQVDESIDNIPDDAAEFLAEREKKALRTEK